MARDFRRRTSIGDDVFRNYARHTVYPLKALWQVAPQHVIRPKALHRVLRRWQELPPFGRLRLDTQLHASDLLIAEHRISVGRTTFYSWQDGEAEPALAIELVQFECSRRKFLFEYICLALISLHALARRFERCTSRADADIIQDITATVDAHQAALASTDSNFEIRCEHGVWLGTRKTTHFNGGRESCQTLAVRTFLEDALVPA